MVFFNYATMQMAAKIVYYGPGLCGKTTNLQYIYQKTSPKSRGEMVSLETETDRTLFFDLLPLDVGNIAGFKTRFQLYTVPGQVFYNSTRKLVLRGVDGIVFVADSQIPMMEANIESLSNLRENVQELGLNLDEIPMVFQYNKRDLSSILSVDELERHLNLRRLPYFEASALMGTGIFETLKGISKSTLISLRKKALGEEKVRVPETRTGPTEKIEPTTPPPFESTTEAPPDISNEPPEIRVKPSYQAEPSLEEVISTAPPILPTEAELDKETVEFSELLILSTKPTVKKIEVSSSDIALKLDALRDMYTKTPYVRTEKKARDFSLDALEELLESTKAKERSINRRLKIKLDPHEMNAVKNLSVDFNLIGDSIHKRFSNAVNVSVEAKANPKRIILKVELEISKK